MTPVTKPLTPQPPSLLPDGPADNLPSDPLPASYSEQPVLTPLPLDDDIDEYPDVFNRLLEDVRGAIDLSTRSAVRCNDNVPVRRSSRIAGKSRPLFLNSLGTSRSGLSLEGGVLRSQCSLTNESAQVAQSLRPV